MTKLSSVALTIALIACSLVINPAAQTTASISGTVVDEKGKVVPGAQVRADPLDGRPRSDIVLEVDTDNSGHFSFTSLDLIAYKLFAMKEGSGYPNTAFAFYSNHIFPTVNLTNASPHSEVLLKIGPRGGAISGTVRDETTGGPIDATFLLRRAADPDNWVSMSQLTAYRVLVPPGVGVLLEVSSPGYKTFYYGGRSDPLARPPLRLESGEQMTLDIRLEPEEHPKSKN